MLLDEVKNIWGIPIDTLKSFNKKYLRSLVVSYVIDIVVFTILVILMIKQKVGAESYFICCLVVCFAFTMYSNTLIDKDKAEACRFYRRHRKSKVEEAYYDLDANKLYSILYCSGCKRVKEDKALSYYYEIVASQCLADYNNCKRVMKYMSRYEVEEPTENSICLNIVRGTRKVYFVNVKEDSINE